MKKSYLTRKFTGVRSKLIKYSIAIFYFSIFIIINQSLKAQTPVTAINTNAVPATPSSYIEGGSTYNWGQGTDLFLTSVEFGGDTFLFDASLIPSFNIIRVDNVVSTGFRSRIFAQRITDFSYQASLPAADTNGSRMEDALLQPIINRGALDVFHNVNVGIQ